MDRPKITIPLDRIDRLVEVIGIVAVLTLITLPLYFYSQLPDTIPSHFNWSGTPDRYGAKNTIFLFPLIGIVAYFILAQVIKFPHIFNYPVEITPENAKRQYTIATKMIRYLNVTTTVVFAYLTFGMIRTALGQQNGLGQFIMPLLLALVFGIIGYSFFQAKSKT